MEVSLALGRRILRILGRPRRCSSLATATGTTFGVNPAHDSRSCSVYGIVTPPGTLNARRLSPASRACAPPGLGRAASAPPANSGAASKNASSATCCGPKTAAKAAGPLPFRTSVVCAFDVSRTRLKKSNRSEMKSSRRRTIVEKVKGILPSGGSIRKAEAARAPGSDQAYAVAPACAGDEDEAPAGECLLAKRRRRRDAFPAQPARIVISTRRFLLVRHSDPSMAKARH